MDLVDEAAAKIRMEMNSAPAVIDDAKRKLIQLEIEREALKKEKDIHMLKKLMIITMVFQSLTLKQENNKNPLQIYPHIQKFFQILW